MKVLLSILGLLVISTGCATANSYDEERQQGVADSALAKKAALVKVTKIEPTNCRLVGYYQYGSSDAKEFYQGIKEQAAQAKGNVALIDGITETVETWWHAIGRVFSCPQK
jgi:hypothetical protein